VVTITWSIVLGKLLTSLAWSFFVITHASAAL
jgi:hypothetical protein